ncbi:hypothetical protein NX059_009591 [Plenodomus lindquistii]|nr:hypothetical protein NX059_009591 [Plenodomus lindquistii]
MRVKDKADGDEVDVVNNMFMKREGVVVAMLQAIDVCRDEGFAWKIAFVQTSLMSLQALFGSVVVFCRSINRSSAFLSREM